MGFEVTAAAYGSFMGRFSEPLAPAFADAAGVSAGQRVLDVGAGPGALTAVLVAVVGADHVAAIDPSQSFVAALHERLPDVDARAGAAESLPWADDSFDAALAQLVVHFMRDAVAGLREMSRVTRPGGTVAACVWDHAGGGGPLSLFWDAVHELDPLAGGERGLAGAHEGHLVQLFEEAGLVDVTPGVLSVEVPFTGVDDWWEPFTYGVGPAGAYVADLDEAGQAALKAECARRLPDGPFTLTASAWLATGAAP
ncbi:Ubiquinone/menaquinone biosynthesis C-methylase UbiE [Pedococcus dokdonensis]|uniref:Ubiquinone/menaquinone biosynthesis C-methylase UbiE n=1 Tax=Pedococcus dokdonensis TaxID=443156 RepID=A0A1H0NLF9_9MICO|nr:class I SAM-dependent methyltransferase [Pedococcus dokdonensis]SDO93180.1 Ubiquinone/menaquinone biosynthesis C-methylase UbiE [Pedococcus dokdonensis]